MARSDVITVSMRELDRLKTVQAVVDGIPLFSMQFAGVAGPSIHAGFRLVPTRNPHKINHLLTGLFPHPQIPIAAWA